MSDYRPNIFANFINRRTGKVLSDVPIVNRITINKDIRQFTDSFDFDFLFSFKETIDLRSHDFVEFYIKIDNANFQICCGFIEDFVKETTGSSHKFQGNGRDFLGQLLNIPFQVARPVSQTQLMSFTNFCIGNTYLSKYLDSKHITRKVLDEGAYSGTLVVQQLSDAKIGPVLQQSADEVFNLVYQNRLGQVVVWGNSAKDKMTVPHTLNETGDFNVERFVLRENFSKVISQIKIFYSGGEQNIDFANTPSQSLFNSDEKARQIYQPEIRTFQTASLITTGAGVSLGDKKDLLAQSIMRKSNQNLAQVVIKATLPFYVTNTGAKIAYEINQVWNIKSKSWNIDQQMRLAGIAYSQTNSSFDVELMFIGKETLV